MRDRAIEGFFVLVFALLGLVIMGAVAAGVQGCRQREALVGKRVLIKSGGIEGVVLPYTPHEYGNYLVRYLDKQGVIRDVSCNFNDLEVLDVKAEAGGGGGR